MAQSWPDPVANQVVPAHVKGLTHGPAIGRATSDGVRVWIRTAQPVEFRIVYDTSLPLSPKSPSADGSTSADRDNTGVADLTDLKSDTRYYYTVVLDGELVDPRFDFQDPWPSFRTLPDGTCCIDAKCNPGGLFNVTFAIGHCADQGRALGREYGNPPAFGNILSRHRDEVQFAVVNGDIIYEECRDGTIDGVRANYRSFWDRVRSFSKLMQYVPMVYTYDDHDVGWDIHGCGQIGLGRGRHLIRDYGLRAYEDWCEWANYDGPQRAPIRLGAARFVKGSDILEDRAANFSTLKPETVSTIHVAPYTTPAKGIKSVNAGVYGLVEVIDAHRLRLDRPMKADEAEMPYSIGSHHYFDWRIANCHFFALDTRGERTVPGNTPEHFILGDAQRKWLLDGLRKTDADFVFLISPDPCVIHHTALHMLAVKGEYELLENPPAQYKEPKGDGFSSFLTERKLLLDAMDAMDKQIIWVTGDVHNAMAIRISDNVWEFLAGPLNSSRHPIGTCGGMPCGGPWNSLGRDVMVRWAAPSPDDTPYWLNHNAFYCIVQVNNVLRCPRRDTAGVRDIAYDAPQVVFRFHDAYTGRLVYAESISTADVVKSKSPKR